MLSGSLPVRFGRMLTLLILLTIASAPVISAQETTAFVHDVGTSCIPENPQGIAVFDYSAWSLMFSLGIEPVAHFGQWEDAFLLAHPEQTEAMAAFLADSVRAGSEAGSILKPC